MPRLDAATRNIAIGRLQAGESKSSVARRLNVSQSTISRLAARYKQTGTTNDRPRTGRPRITTPAQDRYIRVLHLRDRTATGQTVRNRLREHGPRARRPYVGNVLRRHHRAHRLGWCNNVTAWNLRN
ncbi:paired box pox-meso protein-like [Haliotis cracherodii]|uniref:paired box pox-meso protein-like n=1 Tax=Haliotis cracherodii TaxID=6455 RepID=UPI0039E96A5E